jgi:hypothetical protein
VRGLVPKSNPASREQPSMTTQTIIKRGDVLAIPAKPYQALLFTRA